MEFHTVHSEFVSSITYFHNRFHGLVDLDPDLLAQGQFQLTNLDKAITEGWEFSFKLSPQAAVSCQANLTYLKTRITETGAPLRNRPKWRGGLGLTIHMSPTISLSSRVTFLNSRLDFQIPTQTTRVGGYTKTDATITYRPLPNWQWYVAIENLGDASYEEFRGFPAPPPHLPIGNRVSLLSH